MPLTELIYRSAVVGLAAAAVALLVVGRGAPAAAPSPPGVVVVDVARAAAGDHVLDLLGLAPGERVIAIDDRPASTEDVAAAWRLAAPGDYLDLAVASPGGAVRRLLILAHG